MSAASTLFVSHGVMPQQKPSHIVPPFATPSTRGVVQAAMWLASPAPPPPPPPPRPRPVLSAPPRPPPRPRLPARATRAAAAAATTGARHVAAANLHAAPIADVHVDLFAVVAAHLPSHERGIERGFSLGIGDLHVEVIEEHRLPSGRLERCLERRVVARGASCRGRGRRTIPAPRRARTAWTRRRGQAPGGVGGARSCRDRRRRRAV